MSLPFLTKKLASAPPPVSTGKVLKLFFWAKLITSKVSVTVPIWFNLIKIELDEMILHAIQSSQDTLRKSLDGTKAVLKWDGDTPSCFDGMTTYNHSAILTELSSDEWSSDA